MDQLVLRKIIVNSGISFRENGSSYVFDCPRCHKHDKLAMFKQTGRFVCYYCRTVNNFRGRPEFALAELIGKPIKELQKALYGDEIPNMVNKLVIQLEDIWEEDEEAALSIPENVLPIETAFPPDYVGMEKPESFVRGARYLHSRGLTPEHVKVYDIKYSPIDRRVVFPVKVDGKLIGWQARYIDKTKVWNEAKGEYFNIPKILTSATLKGKGQRWLMFQDRLKGSEHCILAEGPVTAIKAHKCGGNVASMGKAVSSYQLDIIRKSVKKLYIALDPDAGLEIAKLAYDLYDDLQIYLLQPPQNYLNLDSPENDTDLGDLSDDTVYELFKKAKPEPRGRLYISLGGVLCT